MVTKVLKILVLFDVPTEEIARSMSPEKILGKKSWADERDIVRALSYRGHLVSLHAIAADLRPLITKLEKKQHDVVFNACESFNASRQLEANLAGVIEMLGVPHTGAGSGALQLCKDKAMSKKILQFHSIHTPDFCVVRRGETLSPKGLLAKPRIVKPLALEASEGIVKDSLVRTEKQLQRRIATVHSHLEADAIVEEFIDGQEVYVGVLGNERLTVLPPVEVFATHAKATSRALGKCPFFMTRRAKWDDVYRRRLGIVTRPWESSPLAVRKLEQAARDVYRALGLRGYARLDFRVTLAGDAYFLEANPNPGIARDEEFTQAAKLGGLDYESMIERITRLGCLGSVQK